MIQTRTEIVDSVRAILKEVYANHGVKLVPENYKSIPSNSPISLVRDEALVRIRHETQLPVNEIEDLFGIDDATICGRYKLHYGGAKRDIVGKIPKCWKYKKDNDIRVCIAMNQEEARVLFKASHHDKGHTFKQTFDETAIITARQEPGTVFHINDHLQNNPDRATSQQTGETP